MIFGVGKGLQCGGICTCTKPLVKASELQSKSIQNKGLRKENLFHRYTGKFAVTSLVPNLKLHLEAGKEMFYYGITR